MPITLTETLIAAHERLYPSLAALLKQVERVRGNTPVPEETGRLSQELCREAAKLLGREGRGIVVPAAGKAAPLDHAGLAVALGQAVAGLEAFEAAHSEREGSGDMVWHLGDGTVRPVARQRSARSAPTASRAFSASSRYDATPEQMRETVLKRILQRENAVYLEGYRDGLKGKPPRKPLTEIGPVNESTEIN